jgi:hypothetical protein
VESGDPMFQRFATSIEVWNLQQKIGFTCKNLRAALLRRKQKSDCTTRKEEK